MATEKAIVTVDTDRTITAAERIDAARAYATHLNRRSVGQPVVDPTLASVAITGIIEDGADGSSEAGAQPSGTNGDTESVLTWTASTATGLWGYLVEVTADGGGAPSGVTGDVVRAHATNPSMGEETYTFTGLTNATTYRFKIYVVRYVTAGTLSDQVVPTT